MERDCTNCIYKSKLFKYLSNDELKTLNKNRYYANYNKGEIIFKQGTAMTHLMSFSTGLAKVYIEGLNKKNLILRLILPGEFIGGPGMYTDFKHHFSIKAVEDSTACFIEIETFKTVMEGNPVFAMQMHKLANEAALHSFQKFVSLTQKQMPGRIADVLLYLSNFVYKANPAELTISRQDIADMTALSKESVIRILKQFKDDKIITLEGDTLNILDKESLENTSIIG